MSTLLVHLIALLRNRQLARQRRVIEGRIQKLPRATCARLSVMTLREIGQAAGSPYPHLYGTPADARYLPWGSGTVIGYERAASDNPEIAMRGIALWLASAYHETKSAPIPALQERHRQLLRLVRDLKALQSAPANDAEGTIERWMQPTATI